MILSFSPSTRLQVDWAAFMAQVRYPVSDELDADTSSYNL